jgi:hypothetical protein
MLSFVQQLLVISLGAAELELGTLQLVLQVICADLLPIRLGQVNFAQRFLVGHMATLGTILLVFKPLDNAVQVEYMSTRRAGQIIA